MLKLWPQISKYTLTSPAIYQGLNPQEAGARFEPPPTRQHLRTLSSCPCILPSPLASVSPPSSVLQLQWETLVEDTQPANYLQLQQGLEHYSTTVSYFSRPLKQLNDSHTLARIILSTDLFTKTVEIISENLNILTSPTHTFIYLYLYPLVCVGENRFCGKKAQKYKYNCI